MEWRLIGDSDTSTVLEAQIKMSIGYVSSEEYRALWRGEVVRRPSK